MISGLDGDRRRETLVEVNALLPDFSFGKYYSSEEFVINVMSKFIGNENFGEQTNDKDIILKFAGTVETGTVANYGDDGVSQKATIQQTVTSKEDVIVPNPVHLIPYRTFLEVEQPCSNFVFRIRDTGREPEIALFEADGGAWKIDAMKSINEYLTNAITDLNMEQNVTFTVIS